MKFPASTKTCTHHSPAARPAFTARLAALLLLLCTVLQAGTAQTALERLRDASPERRELSNGIPILFLRTPGTETAAVRIAIAGGEQASPQDERYLQTLMLHTFAGCIREELADIPSAEVSVSTEEAASFIMLSSSRDDFPAVMQAAFHAIIFGEVTPIAEDGIAAEQQRQWRLNSGDTVLQLKGKAFAALYQGTAYAPLYDTALPILQETDFKSISRTYTALLNAALYTITVAGDIKPEYVLSSAESTFGLLKNQTARTAITIPDPAPAETGDALSVQLHHIFTADKDADSAPPGYVPVLVPTEVFYDPAQFYFAAPAGMQEQALFNALLIELAARMQKILGGNCICTAVPATATVKLGILQAELLTSRKAFTEAYKTASAQLKKELSAKKTGTAAMERMQAQWAQALCGSAEGGIALNTIAADIMQQGEAYGPGQSLRDAADALERTERKQFQAAQKDYFPASPLLQVFSADTRQ